MTQQTLSQTTIERELAQAFRDVAEAQKRVESASRAAARANAQARDLLDFCIANGVTIKLVTP